MLKTVIGWPAPKKMNTYQAHGSALGAEEVAAVKEILDFNPGESFEIDDPVLAHSREVDQARAGGARGLAEDVRRSGPRASPSARSCSTG